MSAVVFTLEAAQSSGIPVVENGRYSQALHDSIVAYRAARRSGTACTKSKAEVNLSGSKPWRQKGTGRARAGYKSSPVWVGGGVVFGPKPRDYRKILPKNVKLSALKKALSLRIQKGDVILVDSFDISEPKTKAFLSTVSAITDSRNIVVVGDQFSEFTYLAGRNVAWAQLTRASDINAEGLLAYGKVVLTRAAAGIIANRLNS